MKRLAWFIPILMLLGGIWLSFQSADASPDGRITLSAGKTAVVRANNCALHVVKATVPVVKVVCKSAAPNTAPTVPQSVTAKITLSAGQRVAIAANQCGLAILVEKPARVKVICNALPTPTPTTLPDASVTVAPGGNLAYSPATVNIHVGDTVEWTWDGSDHTVTSGNGTPDGLFCSPNDMNCASAPASNSGAKYRHTFTSTGSFQYYCRIHGTIMSGTVNVAP